MAGKRLTRGFACPHCKAVGSLTVTYTDKKSGSLRFYRLFCQACEKPVDGWLELQKPLKAKEKMGKSKE